MGVGLIKQSDSVAEALAELEKDAVEVLSGEGRLVQGKL